MAYLYSYMKHIFASSIGGICFGKLVLNWTYRKVSNIRRTKSQNLNASRLIIQSVEARCSVENEDRRCSNYIWVINNSIAYLSASYIRDLTVTEL